MFCANRSRRLLTSKSVPLALYCLIALLLLNMYINFIGANNAALAAVPASVSEYQVKALYLYYFAKFVDWPANSFSTKTAPMMIGIIGDDNFSSLVEEVTKGKTVQDHPLAVRHLKWSEDIRSCHILFIGSYESKRLAQYANVFQAAPILTITEIEEGYNDKGIMNLFMKSGKVQFEVNLTAAEKVQLHISSKLLRMAKITRGMNQEKKD
jgi:hypothetical protein